MAFEVDVRIEFEWSGKYNVRATNHHPVFVRYGSF